VANVESVSLQRVMAKIERLENRVKRMEKIFFESSGGSEMDLVARKIASEDAEMKAKGRKYLTEVQVKQKYGF